MFYIRFLKYIFEVSFIKFYRYLVREETIRFFLLKVAIVRDWPAPTNVHEVRVFLGMVTYYRRFIVGFAFICVPLFDLLKESDAEIRKKKYRKIL